MLKYGKILVDTDSYTVMYEGKLICLHPKEYFILLLFLKYPNHILNYEAIVDNVWSFDKTPAYSSIRSHIKCIRKAFAQAKAHEEIIETIHGIGYRLNPLLKHESEFNSDLSPSLSVLKKFIKSKAIEYLVLDVDLRVQYLSPNVQDYCDYPTLLKVGIHVGEAFPEFIGFEASFEKVRNKEEDKFEIKGIGRASNPNRPDYINFYVIADESENKAKSGKSLLFVFFEDVSEHMLYKQRVVQRENETYLLLESAKQELSLSKHSCCN